jgi:hypothetical protein
VPREIADFRQGRKTRKGRPLSPDEMPPAELVTVVSPGEAREFFHAPSDERLRRHLRGLRDLGFLVHEPGRLTIQVKLPDGSRGTGYVFRGPASGVPRLRRRRAVYTA